MRDPRMGATIWDGARYITPNPSRTFQLHSAEEDTLPYGATRQVQRGTDATPAEYVSTPTTPHRAALLGSYFLSDPAVFQSYFKVRWDDMFGMRANLAEGTRSLQQLPNPQARGKAEGQAIQPYNPWPSASQLNPQYPDTELKAI